MHDVNSETLNCYKVINKLQSNVINFCMVNSIYMDIIQCILVYEWYLNGANLYVL